VPFTQGHLDPLLRAVNLRQWGERPVGVPISLQSPEMPYGAYTMHVVLTEPNSSNVMARAQAVFSLEP
jgi:hypothetical protein